MITTIKFPSFYFDVTGIVNEQISTISKANGNKAVGKPQKEKSRLKC